MLLSAGSAFQPSKSSIKPPFNPYAKRSGGVEVSSSDKFDEPKILVKAIAGSKLYGTDLPTSDSDYKIVFLPSINEIIRLNVAQAKFTSTGGNAKNTNKDVDVECFELRRYLQMVERGDTVALDLLFTPDDLIIEKKPLWEDLKGICKQHLLTGKAAKTFQGHAKNMAYKFSAKEQRLLAFERVEKAFVSARNDLAESSRVMEIPAIASMRSWKMCEVVEMKQSENGHPQMLGLKVCEKIIPFSVSISYALEKIIRPALEKSKAQMTEANKNDAERTLKALYHAVRVAREGTEFLLTGNITLPRPEASLLLDIRQGKYTLEEVSDMIEKDLAALEEAKSTTKLASKGDWGPVNAWADEIYLTYLSTKLGNSTY